MKNIQLVTIAAAVLCPEGVLANVAAYSGVNIMLNMDSCKLVTDNRQ